MRETIKLTCILFACLFTFQSKCQLYEPHDVFVDGLYSCVGATDVKSADLDNDGDMDVFSCSFTTNRLFWYENLGNKQFGPRNIIDDIIDPLAIVTGDFDNDGWVDIASNSQTDNVVVWYRNLGNQNFSEANIVANDVGRQNNLISDDMDNDGNIDLVGSSLGGNIRLYRGLGDGTWEEPRTVINDVINGNFKIADFNQDGLKDIAYISSFGGRLFWRKHLENFSFISGIIVDNKGGYSNLLATDIDGDGFPDIIGNKRNVNNDFELVWFEKNSGDFLRDGVTINVGEDDAEELIAADYDSDGDIDIVSALGSEDRLVLYENDGSNNFSTEEITNRVDQPRGIFFADLDNDEDLDLLSSTWGDYKVSWYENLEQEGFSDQKNITYNVNQLEDFHYGDVNNDGLIDIISASKFLNTVGWYRNLGGNKYSQQFPILAEYEEVTIAQFVDIDNDGDLDVICGGSPNILSFKNNGNGIFTEFGVVFESTLSAADLVTPDDVDNDGDIDLILSYEFVQQAQVLTNDGQGNFSLFSTISGSETPYSDVKLFDADGDGAKDLFYLSRSLTEIGYLQNDGQGNFSNKQVLETFYFGFHNLEFADYDNDGMEDVITSRDFNNEVVWFKNLGGGNFAGQNVLLTQSSLNSIAVEDLNQDGLQDIVTAHGGTNNITIHLNQGLQNFSSESYATYNEDVLKINLVDLDNDSDIDILASGFFFGSFSFNNLGTLSNSLNSCSEIIDTTIINVIILAGETYTLPDGQIVDEAGTYTTTVTGDDGCVAEFIITKLVQCATPIESLVEVMIFENETHTLPDGQVVSEAGTYVTSIFDQIGCETEIVITELTVCLLDNETIETVILSEGETYELPDGTIVSEAGTYSVELQDQSGCPIIITTVISITTSTNDSFLNNTVLLYPNPSTDYSIIEITDKEQTVGQINLVNQTGAIIRELNPESNVIVLDLTDLSSGMYFMNFYTSEKKFLGSKKLAIAKN